MTDEEVRSMWESLNGNNAMLAKAKNEGLYAPPTDVVGENDVENVEPLSAPLYPTEEADKTYGGGGGNIDTRNAETWGESISRWWNNRNKGGSPFDTAAAAEKLKDDEDADIDYEFFDVGKAASGIGDAIKNTSLYTAHVYNAKNDEYLERCNEIQDKLGVNATVLSQDAFDKAWKLTQEVKQKEKLAGVTDANGHVNMDKLYEKMPYLETIHEAHGDAAALMLLNNAPGLMTINDAYSGEAERLIESVATGFERGALQFKRQLAGLGALGRGLTSDEGLTREEIRGILANAKEMESLPQYSYSSVGGALGGALGSAAENLPLMLTSMIAGFVPYVGTPLAVGVMAAEVAGGNYIDEISKVDDNGKPVYTPREAAIMAGAKGLPEAILEQYKFSQMGQAILGKGTAKKLGELYAKRGAEIAGKESLEAATREIIEERVKSMAKAGLLSGKEELTEEFNQAWTTAVVDNMLQSAFLGDKADLKSTEDILVESFYNALEAVPAVVGFGMMGAGGNLAVNTRGVLDMRERFKRAQGNKLWRNTYENEYRANVIETVGASLDNVEELNGKHPEMMKEILDVENEKNGVKETDVDFRALMQTSEETASQIAEAAGKTQEEVAACLNGTGIMTVDTSVLQQVSHKATPEQKQALRGNLAEVGGQTTNQIIEYAKYLNEAMNAVTSDKVEEEAAAVENFVNTTFTDENDRAEALDIVAANMENPALEVRNRQRENQAALDEIFNPVLNGLRAGMGQGVEIVQQQEDGRGIRVSNNAEWYRNFFADHGRAPTEEELREIAYENIIGTATRYADSQITLNDGTPEAQEYFATVKAEIDGLREEQARLSRMLDVFSNYQSGEFMAQAAMPEGAREAYKVIYDALKASGVKTVSNNARVNAILAARIAERVAQEYRAAGQKDVKAVDILPQIVGGLFTQEDAEALSQFAGEHAETADKVKLAEAQKMESEGKAADEIYKATGWFKGLDNRWRFEIPDNLNDIDFSGVEKFGDLPLARVYYNEALLDAYPQLRQVHVVVDDNLDKNTSGETSWENRIIRLNKSELKDKNEAAKTIVHEVQHLIQDIEEHAAGGSPKGIKGFLRAHIKALTKVSKEMQKANPSFARLTKAIDGLGKAAKAQAENPRSKAERDAVSAAFQELKEARNELSAEDKEKLEPLAWRIRELTRAVNSQAKAYDLYRRLGGEQEAREAENRAEDREQLRQEAEATRQYLNNAAQQASGAEQKTLAKLLELRDKFFEDDTLTDEQYDDLIEQMEELKEDLGEELFEKYEQYEEADEAYRTYEEDVMPQPHKADAIIIFNGVEMPYRQKQDESLAGKGKPEKKEYSKEEKARLGYRLSNTDALSHVSSKMNYNVAKERILRRENLSVIAALAKYKDSNNAIDRERLAAFVADICGKRRALNRGEVAGYVTRAVRSREQGRARSNLAEDVRWLFDPRGDAKVLSKRLNEIPGEYSNTYNDSIIQEIISGLDERLLNRIADNFVADLDESDNEQPRGRLNQGGFSNAKRVTRGQYSPAQNIVFLFQAADQSTFMHEMSHFYLKELEHLAKINPDGQAAKDFATVNEWAEWHDGDAEAFKGTATADYFADLEKAILTANKNGKAKFHGREYMQDELLNTWKQEKFARSFETYLRKGTAPTTRLQKIFRSFKTWLEKIYSDVIGVGVKPSPEVEAVMARMVASDEEIELHAKLKEAESVARKAPDLLDKETGDMYERWEQDAKEEAKEKLLKELIKEQEEKDVAEHMEAFEESERERLTQDPAFGVFEMMETQGLTQEEACEIAGYNSVEAWKQDLEKKGGSFDAALSSSMEAERERYIKEMPNQERLSQMAEEAFAASDYSQQLSALEAEILKRRIDKYRNKATYLLSRALADVEAAINGDPATLHQKILALRYAHRWNKGEAEQIDKMNKIVDDVQLAEEQRREKLKAEYDKLKESTMLNREWLRGVRDAAKGVTKDIKQVVIQQLDSMSAKDATNFRRFVNEAKKAAQESVKHLSAAARAKDNDAGEREYELARQAKMRQTMFEMMAAEALKYRRALQKVQNDMKRVQKGLVSAKGEIDASTRYYIGHIQYMLGFRNSDAPMPQNLSSFDALFRSLKSTNGENGSVTNIGDIDGDVDIPQWLHALILSENRMPKQYKDFTIEELQDMQALVDMLYKTARNKNRMLSEGLEGKHVGEITAELADDFQKTVTVEKGDEGINRYFARILKPVAMLKTLGSTWEKYFYRTLLDGWEKQQRMQMKAAEELNALFDKYYKDKATRRDMRKKKLSVTMPDGTPLTKEMVLAMAMNWGNAGNRLRLRDGMTVDFAPASETDIENIFKQVLTANDWAFVQEAWDYINTYGDPVNDVVENLTGVPMKRVEPLPFSVETSDGTRVHLRGGYYPIAYDPKKSTLKAEQELTTSAKAFGGMVFGTGMGSTKARAQVGLEDSPLLLSMDVLFNHVNQQIHIAAMRLPARDVYKLLQNKEIRYMVEHSIGREAYMELKRWCENVWQKPLDDRDPVKQFLEMGRRNTVGAIMGYRMSVAVLNTLPNFTLMVRELGAMNALEACLDCWMTKGSRAWILEDSPFMRNRASNIDRDIKHAQQESFAPQNPVMDAISRTSGWLIEQTDMIFSLPTYHWTYKKTLNAALEKGATQEQAEKEAHYAAGEMVRKIFGSAETVDQSYYQRSNDVVIKALTPFYTYVSTQANAVFEEYMKGRYQGSNVTITDEGEKKTQKKAFMERWGDMMHAVLFTYVLETAVEQLMRDGITYLTRGDDDEPWDFEGFMRRYASQSLTTFTSALPVVNLGGEAMGQWITGENYPTRGFGITSAAIDRGSKVISDIKKTIQGKGDAIETGRDIAKFVGGTITGFPDTLTDTVFNLARAYNEDYSMREVFWKSLFDKKLKPKDNKKKRKPKKERK